jgi:hypothetical protein
VANINEKLARLKVHGELKEVIDRYLESRRRLEADPKYLEWRRKISEETKKELMPSIAFCLVGTGVVVMCLGYFIRHIIPLEVLGFLWVISAVTSYFLIGCAFGQGK